MFLKLLKHEWKSNSKLLLTLSAYMLGVAILGGLDLRLIVSTVSGDMESNLSTLIMIPAVLFLVCAFLALTIYYTAVVIILLYRFYKSRFTDEGYLTFTLPVKTSHIFLSAGLHILLWEIIASLVLIISFFIILLTGVPLAETGFATCGEFLADFFTEFRNIFQFLPSSYLIVLPLSLISGAIVPMSAIVVGAVIAKKHKILAAIGIMYGCSAISGVISGMITAATSVMSIQGIIDANTMVQIMPITMCIVPVLLASCGYALSIYLMKNKLNLP